MATEVLELEIEASGMQRGAQQATTALDAVATKAKATEGAVANTSRALNAAFATTGGGIQIAQGISQTARAFGELNLASAGFAASRSLLEIGRTAQDFRNLSSAVGATGGMFGTLRAVMRAHPILTIASLIGAAASAMSLFGSNTEKTTTAVRAQATALDQMVAKMRELDIRRGYGAEDPRQGVSGTIDALTQLRLSDRQQFTAADAAGLFGVSQQDLRYALGRGGMGERALELAPPRWDFDTRSWRQPMPGQFAVNRFGRDDVIRAGETLLRDRQPQPPPYGGTQGAGASAGLAVQQAVLLASSQHAERIAEHMRLAEERAGRIASTFAQVGAELGPVLVAAVAQGGGSLRQLLAQIAMNFANQAASAGFGQMFGALGTAVAGGTGTQAAGGSNGGAGGVP